MSERVEKAAAWMYEGLWGVLGGLLRVPRDAPTLPVGAGGTIEGFPPAPGFLKYLKFWFWLLLLPMDIVVIGGWLAITMVAPVAGIILAIPAWGIAIVPDIFAYIAIHLRYDTTWYVITDRSMRIRRGVWLIHETTITFENVQNVSLRQGPVQRYFGIANVVVTTAGGGGGGPGGGHGKGQQGMTPSHVGLIEGIADAERIRDLIMSKMGKSKTAGLGDEHHHEDHAGWTREHVEVLREIRELVRA